MLLHVPPSFPAFVHVAKPVKLLLPFRAQLIQLSPPMKHVTTTSSAVPQWPSQTCLSRSLCAADTSSSQARCAGEHFHCQVHDSSAGQGKPDRSLVEVTPSHHHHQRPTQHPELTRLVWIKIWVPSTAPASLGSLLEMQILRPRPAPNRLRIPEGRAQNCV